jgi:HEPN domain-containing protein
MSKEKNKQEAERWFLTAEDDLDTAVILKDKGKFAHSCFHAQQAGEKALKAAWYFADADPWGHSIKKLIDDLQYVNLTLFECLIKLVRPGMLLDRFYIPTRYPNGLPDLTPDEAFNQEDAVEGVKHAEEILKKVRDCIRG